VRRQPPKDAPDLGRAANASRLTGSGDDPERREQLERENQRFARLQTRSPPFVARKRWF
jgi:hypothetical protein